VHVEDKIREHRRVMDLRDLLPLFFLSADGWCRARDLRLFGERWRCVKRR